MNDRTLVKLCATESCIVFRTVSPAEKSPHSFYITHDDLAELEKKDTIIVRDCRSFAELWRNKAAGTVRIWFTWLSGSSQNLKGRDKMVTVSYKKLRDFMECSTQPDGPKEAKLLSLKTSARPHLVFCNQENLHAALGNPTVRRKLLRFLRNNFNWQDSEKVCFYNDLAQYSFFFREFRNGQPGMCGGLIFHRQETLEKSSYSIHT